MCSIYVYAALIAVDAPVGAWCTALSNRAAQWRTSVTGFMSWGDGRCTEDVRILGANTDEALDVIRADPNVTECQVLVDQPGELEVRLQVAGCPLARVVHESGLIPQIPFRLANGQDLWLIVGQEEQLGEALLHWEAEGRRARIVRTGLWDPGAHGLTARQVEIVEAAIRAGFYDYPRRITVTALAEILQITKSTMSEALIAIESKVVPRFVEAWLAREPVVEELAHASVKNPNK